LGSVGNPVEVDRAIQKQYSTIVDIDRCGLVVMDASVVGRIAAKIRWITGTLKASQNQFVQLLVLASIDARREISVTKYVGLIELRCYFRFIAF